MLNLNSHYHNIWSKGAHQPTEVIQGLESLYRRDWIEVQPSMPGVVDPKRKQAKYKRPLAHGLIYYLIKILSQLYARPVSRSSPQEEFLDPFYWDGLNEVMGELDRWSRLYGTALLGIYYTGEDDAPIHKFSVGPNDFSVHFDNRYSTKPSVVMVRITSEIYHYWTDDEFIVLDENFNVKSKEPNPIGAIPFVLAVTERDPKNPNIGLPFGGLDVVDNAKAIARILKETGWTAVLQRGQPWTTAKDAEIAIAPDYVIRLGSQGDTFGIASSNANVTAMLDTLKELLSQFLITCGLAPDLGVGFASAQVSSGVAIALKREDITLDREQRASMFRRIEGEALSLVGTWLRAAGAPESTAFEQAIIYPHLPIYRTAGEAQALAAFLLDRNMVSQDRALRLLMPELSAQDITTWLEEI